VAGLGSSDINCTVDLMRPLLAIAVIVVCCAPSGARPLRYVAIGASDSVGVGASDPKAKSWPALLASRMPAGTTYVNLGVSGSTVSQALAEQLPQATRDDPDVATIWLAFNDLARAVPPASYRADLDRLLDGLLQTRARVFVANLPDLRGVPATSGVDRTLLAAAVDAYNAQIAAAVHDAGSRVTLVDLFAGSADVISRELVVSADGLHPNDLGYQRIAERFADTMRTSGIPIR
jgi:lysophospholipase L1-like esterase